MKSEKERAMAFARLQWPDDSMTWGGDETRRYIVKGYLAGARYERRKNRKPQSRGDEHG